MPPKRDRPPPSIEGISVIDPQTLAGTDFARFRNDDLYFIDEVTFHPPGDSSKPVSRVLAMTPFALFITDFNGKMDRATRYEDIESISKQKKTVKKFIGSETMVNLLLKIPREVDCLISMEATPANETKVQSLINAVSTLWQYKKVIATLSPDDQANDSIVAKKMKKAASLPITDVESSADIRKLVTESNTDFIPPQEIIRQNEEKKRMMERIEQATAEAITLQKQIEDVRTICMQKQSELKSLEAKCGVDLSQLRKQKQLLQQRQLASHKQITNSEIDLVKIQADVARLREQLDEERANYDNIVQQRISSAGDSVSKQQHEMMMLRQKAQQKEIAKALSKSQALNEALSKFPSYENAPGNVIAKALEAEKKVEGAIAQWSSEMEASNKVEKFLDAINAEIRRLNSIVSEKSEEKMNLLQKREAPSTSAPAAAAGDFDDELFGKASVSALPPSSRSLPDDDDDLLGDGPTTASPAKASEPQGDLDDLLGDTPASSGAPASTVTVDMDLF